MELKLKYDVCVNLETGEASNCTNMELKHENDN